MPALSKMDTTPTTPMGHYSPCCLVSDSEIQWLCGQVPYAVAVSVCILLHQRLRKL